MNTRVQKEGFKTKIQKSLMLIALISLVINPYLVVISSPASALSIENVLGVNLDDGREPVVEPELFSRDEPIESNVAYRENLSSDNDTRSLALEYSEVDIEPPTGNFTEPAAGKAHKNSIDIAAFAADEGEGLNSLQIVMRKASDNSVVGNWQYNVPNKRARTIQGSGSIMYEGDESSGTLSVSDVDLSGLEDGRYNLRLFTSDQASVPNSNSAIYGHFFIDTAPPDGSFIDLPTEPQSGDNVEIKVEIEDVGEAALGVQQIVMRKASDNSVVGNWQYNVSSGNSRNISGPDATFDYQGDDSSGTLEITFDSDGIDGNHKLRLFTKDQLGNGRSDIYGDISFDNTGPEVAFNSPSQDEVVSGNIFVAVTANDENNLDTYCLKLNSGDCIGGEYSSISNGAMPEVSIDTTTLSDGSHLLTAIVTDSLGNVTEVDLTIFVDNTPPPVSPNEPTDSAPTGVTTGALRQLSSDNENDEDSLAQTISGLINDGLAAAISSVETPNQDNQTDENDSETTNENGDVQAEEDAFSVLDMAWYWWLIIIGAGLLLWRLFTRKKPA